MMLPNLNLPAPLESPGKKLILLIDLDGVCADWYGRLHIELSKIFPQDTIPTIEDLTSYFWEESFHTKYHSTIDAIVESKGFYRGLEPYPEAILCLKDIMENHTDWIEPFICTKPSVGYERFLSHSEKLQWVEEHLGMYWAERTILTPDKTLIYGDYLIDDHPNITGANKHPSWTQLLFDQSYNRNIKGVRRFDWSLWETIRGEMRIDHLVKRVKEISTSISILS